MATTDGVFPSPYGLSASGIGYLPTAITEADVASGAIHHAIAVELPGCYGQVYPADRSDCDSQANSCTGRAGGGPVVPVPGQPGHAHGPDAVRPDGVQGHPDLRHGGN